MEEEERDTQEEVSSPQTLSHHLLVRTVDLQSDLKQSTSSVFGLDLQLDRQ